MANQEFLDYVLDQLRLVPGVECRRMFSSHGLSSRGVFFAIAHRGTLYFKTDDATRPAYEAAGSQPFRPTKKMTLRSYHEVPADVLESSARLAEWAGRAVEAQRAGKSRTKSRADARSRRRRKS